MKKLFAAAALALLLLPLQPGQPRARADYQVTITATNMDPIQLGPWYLYWPMGMHFVAPAPTGYPYWPPKMGLPPMTFGGPAVPPGSSYPPAMTGQYAAPPATLPAPRPAPESPVKPASYRPAYNWQAPAYWYDR